MARMERSSEIHVPMERVFGYVADPSHLPEFWPSMMEVKDVEPLPNGGHRFRWLYKMAGMRFEGASECVEYVPNQGFVGKYTGDIEGTATWTFLPKAGARG